MARKEFIVEEVQKIMKDVNHVRNIAIVAHVDHGKTTMTDSLVSRAGLINKETAGEQRVMDFDEQEQARGITINSANISLAFSYENDNYLVNLIDTPGHVDFGGHVTRALRAIDGIVLVIDAVEGIMPQTETVLRQAMKERAKPTVFVNKVDRLIKELKLTPEAMQEKLIKIITGVNILIDKFGPPEYKQSWHIGVEKGNICFGSAFLKWAVSINSMKKSNIGFKEIIDLCAGGNDAELVKKSPIDEVLLGMVIEHLPNPLTAQKYRIPQIWKGDLESELGKNMVTCNSEGKAVGVVVGVVNDPHAGEVALVRLFSGKVSKSKELFLASKLKSEKIQQIGIYMAKDRVVCEEIIAGNIVGIVGLKDIYVGETVSEGEIEPFEQIKHYSEPVITKSIEAKDSKDLARLIQVLRSLSKEDPTLKVTINQETGEHLISGMGELHLEIIEYKIRNEKKLPIITSPPIVVYRESITAGFGPLEGKSPNKHTKLQFSVEPLEKNIIEAIENQAINQGKPKGKISIDKMIEAGMGRDEAKRVIDVYGNNILIDDSVSVQYLNEIMELIIQGFEEAMSKGPLSHEKVVGVKVRLLDGSIHEDPVHRGPAQILPTVRRPIYACMLSANMILQEPKQNILVQVPHEYSNAVITLMQGKRGQLINMEQEGEISAVTMKVPVAELFGFSNNIRGTTQGKAIWYQEYAGYEQVPKNLQDQIVTSIRKRKGEKPEPPIAKEFMDA
ncbi:MAG: elongation factor EF-2 [Candidatus Micrarchaeia archaeon]|jgi:elongation factor 2